jgi:tetratricopeptide (TPR) repeat protein
MRQQDDALAAARKAAELAPKEALYWRNLGNLDLEVDDPVDALRAFEEATRWNDSDAYSFVQAGILNARLDRLPEAMAAFDRALALRADDADARCGAAWIAQRQARPKEPKAASGQAKPSDGQCRDLIERASAAVVLKGPTAFKVTPTVAR